MASMSATSQPGPQYNDDAATLAPISHERLVAALESLDVSFGVDDDGMLYSMLEGGHPCGFGLTGPGEDDVVFWFHARWAPTLTSEELPVAFRAVNEWNATQLFPRALCIPDEDGNCVFVADYLHDYECGVTDAQLSNDISVAITTSINFVDYLNGEFPELVAADTDQSESVEY